MSLSSKGGEILLVLIFRVIVQYRLDSTLKRGNTISNRPNRIRGDVDREVDLSAVTLALRQFRYTSEFAFNPPIIGEPRAWLKPGDVAFALGVCVLPKRQIRKFAHGVNHGDRFVARPVLQQDQGPSFGIR